MYFLYTVNIDGLPSAGTTVYHDASPHTDDERQWDALFDR